MIGSLCGVGRIWYSDLYSESKLTQYAGQKISAEGIIVGEPDVRDTNTKLTVRIDKVLEAKSSENADGRPTPAGLEFREKILVTVPLYTEFHYGDKVTLSVFLEEPPLIESEDGRSFDYKGYLRVRGIWFTSKNTAIKLIEGGHGTLVKTGLFKIKNAFMSSISNVLPEPESNLLGGLLLGAKQSLGKELLTEFQRTGVSHIVVLSGYNIAIVASSIMNALKFLPIPDVVTSGRSTFLKEMFRPKNYSFSFGVLSIILFTILSGGGASAWRAGITKLIVFWVSL
jgi:competence protein ComEC